MAPFSFVSIALKNLRRKAFRTAVLAAAIALLAALLIFALSFSTSVSASLRRATARLGADLLIVPTGARTRAEEYLLEAKNTNFTMSGSIMKQVRAIEGVTALTHQTYLSSIYGVCCDVAATRIIAFDPATDFIVTPWLNKALGRGLKKGEAIAGAGTAENLGLGLLDLEATIYNEKFSVVGVLEQTGTGLDDALFMTEESLNEIVAGGKSPLKLGEISIIFAKLAKGYDPSYVGRVVEGKIPEVDVVPRSDMGRKFFDILADINKIFLITVVLASVLTGLLVWAIFSAIANERAREVGIMRALGARQGHIVRLFLLEVGLLGVGGSLAGALVGTVLSVRLAKSFTLVKSLSASLGAGPRLGIAAVGLTLALLICLVGALVPVGRLKRLEPLAAIRKE